MIYDVAEWFHVCCCQTVKLVPDYKTSPDFPSTWARGGEEWKNSSALFSQTLPSSHHHHDHHSVLLSGEKGTFCKYTTLELIPQSAGQTVQGFSVLVLLSCKNETQWKFKTTFPVNVVCHLRSPLALFFKVFFFCFTFKIHTYNFNVKTKECRWIWSDCSSYFCSFS